MTEKSKLSTDLNGNPVPHWTNDKHPSWGEQDPAKTKDTSKPTSEWTDEEFEAIFGKRA